MMAVFQAQQGTGQGLASRKQSLTLSQKQAMLQHAYQAQQQGIKAKQRAQQQTIAVSNVTVGNTNNSTMTFNGTAGFTTSGGAYYLQSGDSVQIINEVGLREINLNSFLNQLLKIKAIEGLDNSAEIELPDGTRLKFDKLGNYKIEDRDAKVKYAANNQREFNRYVNASDLLEEFIDDLDVIGCPQDKVLKIPIEIFINWIIIRAAEMDNDPHAAKGVPKLEDRRDIISPKCRWCGRFIPRKFDKLDIHFCDDIHLRRFMDKQQLIRIPA